MKDPAPTRSKVAPAEPALRASPTLAATVRRPHDERLPGAQPRFVEEPTARFRDRELAVMACAYEVNSVKAATDASARIHSSFVLSGDGDGTR